MIEIKNKYGIISNSVIGERIVRRIDDMRTSLKYGVSRDDKIDHTTGKETRAIKFRGFTFCVSGAESEAEHLQIVDSFEKYLSDNGYVCDGFGDGSWDDCVRLHDTKSFLYLNIPINDTDAKEEVNLLYKEWKKGL